MSQPGTTSIRVLGLGNVLMGDDGFGPSVIDALERGWELPPEVELVDVGTPGLNLTPFLTGAPRIVLVDLVKHGGAPGAVRAFAHQEVLSAPPPQRVSPHDPGLREALLALDFAGEGPLDFRLVGAQPERVATGPGLTPRLAGAVGEAVEAVVAILAGWGARPCRRATPLPGAPWWAPPAA